MGVAYYIEFDNEALDVDQIDGKAVARAMDSLNALALELGIKPLEEFMGQSMDDIGDMLGEDIELQDVEDGAASWFEPREGLTVLETLIAALQAEPGRVKASKAVVEDLQSYRDALLAAQKHGARWHLAIDF